LIAALCLAASPFALYLGIHIVALCGDYPLEDLAPPRGSTRIYDASGRMLREDVRGGARSRWVPLEQISPIIVDATIAVEDAHFRDHGGVRWRSVARATGQLVANRRVVSGASTITMQLVRLVHPHGRGLVGKLGEMVDALRLERAIDKAAILEQYLNRSPFGANTVGIEAASHRYFGKPSLHLSLAEAALLAGLPQAPSRLDPLVNREAARARQELVLARMVDTGAIDEDARRAALAEPLRFVQVPPQPTAMHFTDWVLALRDAPPGDIQTTLDGDLQSDVERMVADHVAAHRVAGMTHVEVAAVDPGELGGGGDRVVGACQDVDDVGSLERLEGVAAGSSYGTNAGVPGAAPGVGRRASWNTMQRSMWLRNSRTLPGHGVRASASTNSGASRIGRVSGRAFRRSRKLPTRRDRCACR
jgi:penicillin-binding protein 1C